MAVKADVVIIGAGGMGALFGSILQAGGLNVVLQDANLEHVEAIRREGLQIKGFGGDRKIKITAISDPSQIQSADLLLFQCKGNASREAAQRVKHLTQQGAVCISFQNGLGNEEGIAEQVGPENVLGGLTTMAGFMTGPGQIQDFSRVPSYIGEMECVISERSLSIAGKLSKAGLETHAVQNIQLEIWKNYKNYENKVYMLPKYLDEKVAKLHLKKLGVELEKLSDDQAEYIGVNVEGPFKPDYYRY